MLLSKEALKTKLTVQLRAQDPDTQKFMAAFKSTTKVEVIIPSKVTVGVFEEFVKSKLFYCFESRLLDRVGLHMFVDDQHYFPSERRKPFKVPINSLYQLSDVAEGLEAANSSTLHMAYRVAFKDFINYLDLIKHMADPECFPEALCRKMVRKTKAMALSLNPEINFTQNTLRSNMSGLYGRMDPGFSIGEGTYGLNFGMNRNSQAFPTMNGFNSIEISNRHDFQPPSHKPPAFHLNSFQDINKYIHAEEPPIKKVDDSKIKSLRPKIGEVNLDMNSVSDKKEEADIVLEDGRPADKSSSRGVTGAQRDETKAALRYNEELRILKSKIDNLK